MQQEMQMERGGRKRGGEKMGDAIEKGKHRRWESKGGEKMWKYK